jgi:hypothetical protein
MLSKATMSLRVVRVLMIAVLISGAAGLPTASRSQVAISPQVYAQLNGYLTGSATAPVDSTILTQYSTSGSFALVSWAGCPLGLDTGGQALLTNASGNWALVEASGGAFLATDLERYGVGAADATALEANLTNVVTPNCLPFNGRRTDWPNAPRIWAEKISTNRP